MDYTSYQLVCSHIGILYAILNSYLFYASRYVDLTKEFISTTYCMYKKYKKLKMNSYIQIN